MELDLDSGTYVVAVSGGVDSISLLHMLMQKVASNQSSVARKKNKTSDKRQATSDYKPYRFVVAHLDHGIRLDSVEDRKLVQEVTKGYGLPFVYNKAALGAYASEDQARRARYDFLQKVREAVEADGIITAHHQDDLLETVIMKLMRGTNRAGFSALRSSPLLHRPLLHLPKHQIKRYALDNQLKWREDSTNLDTQYLRNHIRHNVVPKLSEAHKRQLLDVVHKAHDNNQEIHSLLTAQLHMQPAVNQLFRGWFIGLPHAVSREVMAQWLRNNGLRAFDKKTIELAVANAKTLSPGKKFDIPGDYKIKVDKKVLALEPLDR